MSNKNMLTSFKYVIICFFAVLFTWLVHEFAHWLIYYIYDINASLTINSVSVLESNTDKDIIIFSTAFGSIISILQALIIYLLLIRKWNKYYYQFLFVVFYMRLIAAFISLFNPNDEAVVSSYLQIGKMTLPIIVVITLFFMVLKISTKYHIKKSFQIKTLLTIMFFSSFLILIDQYFVLRII